MLKICLENVEKFRVFSQKFESSNILNFKNLSKKALFRIFFKSLLNLVSCLKKVVRFYELGCRKVEIKQETFRNMRKKTVEIKCINIETKYMSTITIKTNVQPKYRITWKNNPKKDSLLETFDR